MSRDLTQKLNGSQDEKLDRIIAAVERLETRLDSLETKVDKRLKDTLPMWEAVQAQLTELRTEVKADLQELRTEFKADLNEFRTEFKADLQELRTEVKADIETLRQETEKGLRKLRHQFDLFNRSIGELYADLRDQGERLDKLEKVGS
ncbi:MAG: hypothetical protein AABN34_23635 [Acidobacteriota bacterium]